MRKYYGKAESSGKKPPQTKPQLKKKLLCYRPVRKEKWDGFFTAYCSELIFFNAALASYSNTCLAGEGCIRILPGQVFDSESGVFQNHHREYQALKGRYLTSDPIGLAGGSMSLYGYVLSNPLGAIDPTGLMNITAFPSDGGGGSKAVGIPGGGGGTGIGVGLGLGLGMAAAMNTQRDKEKNEQGQVCKPAIPDVLPADLCEQLALAAAKAGAGVPIVGAMADEPRLVALYGPGPWIKMQHTHVCPSGRKVVIHYFSNGRGRNVELKLK